MTCITEEINRMIIIIIKISKFKKNNYNSFKAVGSVTPKVVEVTFREFSMVTSKVIKVNQDKIIDDIKKREIPRFRSVRLFARLNK